MSAIAMYLRLSEEDINKEEESNSIIGQRYIIENYIRKNKIYPTSEIVEFIDDGYSGTNMNRPGIQKLLEQIKLGNIKCIIVKDLSRFSRDYLELGSYMEQIFPFMKIRFIAINDNYDSENTMGGIGELDIQFKGLLYDFYSKDLSTKVKSNRNALVKKGKAITWAAPYGYIKDPMDNNKYIIDKETAPVVKKIYELALEGLSLHKVAKILNEKEIPTPAMRKAELTKMKYNLVKDKPKVWNLSTLSRITSNYVYTGALVSNTSGIKEVGSGRSLPNPKEDWVIVEGTHEAIVSKEEFDKVQEIKKARVGTYRYGKRTSSPLEDSMECSHCKRKMSYGSLKGKDRHFYCRMNRIADLGCIEGKIEADAIENIVFKAITHHLKLYSVAVDNYEKIKKLKDKDLLLLRDSDRSDQLSIEKTNKNIQTDYERFKLGDLSKEEFLIRKKLAKEEIEKIKKGIEERKISNNEKFAQIEEEFNFFDEIKGFLKAKTITKEMVETLIEKVILEDESKMEIIWKFEVGNLNKTGLNKE